MRLSAMTSWIFMDFSQEAANDLEKKDQYFDNMTRDTSGHGLARPVTVRDQEKSQYLLN